MTGQEPQMPDAVRRVDPRGLIREAYRIEGIALPDCRTIFLDWSLGDTGTDAVHDAVACLLTHYGADAPEHPMTHVLRAALEPRPEPKRRGGFKARRRR